MKKMTFFKKTAQLAMALSIIGFIPLKSLQAQAEVEIVPTSGSPCIDFEGPNSRGNYTLDLISGSANNFRWFTEGDLRIVGYNSDSSVVSVESYTNRPAPKDDPYGKGRLWLVYNDPAVSSICGDPRVYYDIYKTFEEQAGIKIVGPDCAQAGDTVTFSIDALVSVNLTSEIGIDRYYWDYTSGLVDEILYYSGDSSSITFVMGNLTGKDTLFVDIGQCNLNDGFRYSLPIGQSVDSISFLIGKEPVECLPIGINTYELAFTPQNEINYEWEIVGSWGYSGNLTGSSVTLHPDNSDATIKVFASNDCETRIFEYRITRSLSDSNYIVGPTCLPPNSNYEFLLNELSSGVQMNWTVTGTGWNVSAGEASTTSPIINVGTATGTIIVSTTNCPNEADTLTVYVQPQKPGTISGDTCVTQGDVSAKVYSVVAVDNATSYKWFYPNGWNTSGATNSNSVTLIPNGFTVGQVGVVAIGCSESDTAFINIGFASEVPDTILMSKSCVRSGGLDTIVFRVDPIIAGETYEWDIPSGLGNILNYQSTADNSKVMVETLGNDGVFIVRARSKSSCGASGWDTLEVEISSLNVSVNFSYLGVANYYKFEVSPNPVSGATYYQWYIDNVPGLGGSSQTAIIVLDTALPATACVEVSDSNGCVTRACAFGSLSPMLRKKHTGTQGINSLGSTNNLQVYPNPTNDVLNIQLDVVDNYKVMLFDITGKMVINEQINSDEHQIDLSNLRPGNYFLGVKSSTFQEMKTIIVN